MQHNDPASCWEANAESWTRQTRAGFDIYRDNVNTPAFLSMLPPVSGLSGLDIGCGEGHNTRHMAKLGAAMTAIDISPTFIRHARESEEATPLNIAYSVGNALDLPFPDASFDFAVAFMSMMDVGDPLLGMKEAARVIRPGGFFQFSILHPCFAPPYRKVLRDGSGKAEAVAVADYFKTGPFSESWYFSAVTEEEKKTVAPFHIPYVHLTLSMWLNHLRGLGLVLDRLGEPTVSDEVARKVPEVADTQVAGIFLHIRAVRPASQ